jgi:alpha-1,2-mannosyltransferase
MRADTHDRQASSPAAGTPRWELGLQIALAVTAGAWLIAEWVRILVRKQVEGDFYNHWEFGRRFAAGLPIYRGGLNAVYLPLWALLHAGLTIMPPRVAALVVFPVAPLALALIVFLLATLAAGALPLSRRGGFWAVALAVFLTSPFISRDLPLCGQNLALVALTWSGLYLWIRRRQWPGAMLLGLAIALKCTPLIFLGYLLLKRQWRMAGLTLLFVTLFTLAPALHMGWSGPGGYAASVRQWAAFVGDAAARADPAQGSLGYEAPGQPGRVVTDENLMNLSLKPALARYLMHLPAGHLGRPAGPGYFDVLDLSPRAAGIVVKVVTGLLLLGAAWLFRRPVADHGAPAVLWELAAVSVLMLLVSPITWKQHCVALLPAAYLTARRLVWGVRGRRPRGAAAREGVIEEGADERKGRSESAGNPWDRKELCSVPLLLPKKCAVSPFLGDAVLLGVYGLLALLPLRGPYRPLADLADSYHLKTAAMILLLVLTLRGWRDRRFKTRANPISESTQAAAPTP